MANGAGINGAVAPVPTIDVQCGEGTPRRIVPLSITFADLKTVGYPEERVKAEGLASVTPSKDDQRDEKNVDIVKYAILP